jgi:hypothetical protein
MEEGHAQYEQWARAGRMGLSVQEVSTEQGGREASDRFEVRGRDEGSEVLIDRGR